MERKLAVSMFGQKRLSREGGIEIVAKELCTRMVQNGCTVQDYFKNTYDRDTWFIPNGVNCPEIRKAELITQKFGLTENSYILFLGRLVPEKGMHS